MRPLAPLVLLLVLVSLARPGIAGATSLRFHGNGVGDIDRVKVRIDDPADASPGPPADVGAGDFTLELWLRGALAENTAGPRACGDNIDWIFGNVVLDRDRYSQDRKFGLSLVAGVPIFGVSPGGAWDFTVCGTASVLDGDWHHLAVQRRAADGRLWMHVDGAEVADVDGPDGPLDYPDDGVPGPFCGGPCVGSDPFVVFGAEKHDAGASYPSFSGWLDEVRFSTVLRYPAPFTRPVAPFVPDGATAALWHFDEGAGDTLLDAAPGGASGGRRSYGTGGTRPSGPEWSLDSPVATAGVGPAPAVARALRVIPNPAHGEVELSVRGDAGAAPGARLVLRDVAGRHVRTLAGVSAGDAWVFRWDRRDEAGRPARAGIVFAELAPGGPRARLVLLP